MSESLYYSSSQSPPDINDDAASAAAVASGLAYGDNSNDLDQQDADKKYHSKRPHKKSRAGCKNCKARKVKCDEARPTCRSCRLRKTECVYPPTPQTKASSGNTTSPPNSSTNTTTKSSPTSSTSLVATKTGADLTIASPSSSSSPSSLPATGATYLSHIPTIVHEPLFRPSSGIDEIDMRLLWFYTTDTSASFSVEQGYKVPANAVMRTALVQHAFENPFLMDTLFALASLHLQFLGDGRIDVQRAAAYRAKSFAGFKMAVEDPHPDRLPALIANSLIITAVSTYAFREPDCKELYILDWMVVWRGIGIMINLMGFVEFRQSDVLPLFSRPPIDLDGATGTVPVQLLLMISSINANDPSDPDHADAATYYTALTYLGALYHHLRSEGFGPIMKLRIITWFTYLPAHFIELARNRRPRALVIIAHYTAFLKLTTDVWWLEGVGQRSIEQICRYLGSEWTNLLTVPLIAMNTDDHLALARVLLGDPDWYADAISISEDDLAQSLSGLRWVNNLGKVEPIDEVKPGREWGVSGI
jgi:hypothetical protein